MVGVVLLTGSAVNEDYRAVWTDESAFADVEAIFKEVGSDKEKIAEHFKADKGAIEKFTAQLLAYEKFKKSKDYLNAVGEAEREAERVVTLASGPTLIPTSGAMTLLRNDPKTQGPKVFATHCASCHTHVAPGAANEATAEESSSAPNLYGFASREWIGRLLDPKHVAGPDYFGNTSHRDGSMANFVTETIKDWSADDVQNVVIALSAEAQLPKQAEADEKDAERITAGKKIITDAERLRKLPQVS